MIPSDIDRLITTWLEEEAGEDAPDYLDETITGIDRTRQRPAWLSLERWLPMQLTMPRVAIPRAVSLIVPLVLLLVLVIAAVLIVGTQRRLPPPFGPAMTGLIAFDAGGDIIVANADGSNRRPFAATAADEFGPAWSRDGTRLAFWSVDRKSGVTQIVVADADGGRRILIGGDLGLFPDERRWAPVWSPDGRMLLLATGTGVLHRINSDGTDARRLGDDKVLRYYPTWSPDGTQIAYLSGFPSGGYISVMDADGRVETQIGKGWGGGPIWSPDGSRLAYWVPVAPGDIIVATRRGTEWTESVVVGGPTDDVAPVWSNDGTRLAFLRMDGATKAQQLVVAPAAGGGERIIATGAGTLTFARSCWTPDDQSIVALSFEAGEAAYVVAAADGSGAPLRIKAKGNSSLDSCGFQRLGR